MPSFLPRRRRDVPLHGGERYRRGVTAMVPPGTRIPRKTSADPDIPGLASPTAVLNVSPTSKLGSFVLTDELSRVAVCAATAFEGSEVPYAL
jgi:hypothetical protein